MPPRRNQKRKPQYTKNYSTTTLKKQNKSLVKRLLEISIALDGHIYSNEPLTTADAVKYFEEITSYKLENCTDERILQVREKLLRCMTGVIIENKPETHQDTSKTSKTSFHLNNSTNIAEDAHHESDTIVENHSTRVEATEINDSHDNKNNKAIHVEKCGANFGNNLYEKINLSVTKVDHVSIDGNIPNFQNMEIAAVGNISTYSELNEADISESQVNIDYKEEIFKFRNEVPTKIQTCIKNGVEKCNEIAITNNFDNNLYNGIQNLYITEVDSNISIESNINNLEKAAYNHESANNDITSNNSTSILVSSNKITDFSESMKSRFEDPIKIKNNSKKKYNASKINPKTTKKRKVVTVEKYKRDENETRKAHKETILKAPTKATKDICAEEHLNKTVKKRKRAATISTNSNCNKNTEDLSWIEDLKYVRVITDEELDTTNFTEDFWCNLNLPPDWDDDFTLPL